MHDRHEEQTNQADVLLNTILERLSQNEPPAIPAIAAEQIVPATAEQVEEEDLSQEPFAVLVDDISNQSQVVSQEQTSEGMKDAESKRSMIYNAACFTAGVAVAGLLASFSR